MAYISTLCCIFTLLATVVCKSFVGFEPNPGLFPVNGQKLFTPEAWNKNQMLYQRVFRAGVGYSLKRRDVTFPMFVPGNIESVQDQATGFRQYAHVDEMLTSMYLNQHEASATMYSHREAGDAIYRDFFAESTHGAVSITNKVYVKASIGSELDPDFQDALRLLPETYDQQVYLEFCDLWGCSVVTKALFGGSIESQLSIRSCSSVPNADLDHDLGIASTSGRFPDMSYSRFTRTRRINIVGGNPEIQDPITRIVTFDENPVLVLGSLVPLHQHLKDGNYQISEHLLENLERAYNEELKQAQEHLDTMKQQGQQKAIEDLSSQKVYHAIANNEVYGMGCIGVHAGCLLPAGRPYCRTSACVNLGEVHVSLGTMQSVVTHDFLGTFVEITRTTDGLIQPTFKQGNYFGQTWVLKQEAAFVYGCMNHQMQWGDTTVTQFVCSNCQPVINHAGANEYLDCVCPGF